MSDTVAFTGGMNVPGVVGRANATVPLARLVISEQTLTLRPRSFARMSMTDFVVALSEIEAAFGLRGLLMTAGVGVRLRNGLQAYFWTYTQQGAVLAALAERGVPIEPEARRARGLWSLRTNDGDGAILSQYPVLLQALTPLLVVIGTAVMLVFLVGAHDWWTRTIVIAVWTWSMTTTLRTWLKGRSRSGH